MKRHRLGAWIGQESYLDKTTGEHKKCASWSVKYDALDRRPGERRQSAARGFASETDAIAWWVLQKQNRHRPVAKAEAVKEAPMTLDAFLDRWLKGCATTLSAGALATCEKHSRLWIRPSLGHVLLCDLERSPSFIEQAQATWLTQPRKDGRKGVVTPGFVKSVRSTLNTALNRAKKLQLITVNPCEFVDPPRCERDEMRSLSPEEAQQYLAAFDRTDLGTAIAVAIGSGCRRGELLALRWSDVDLKQGTLRIARSLERITLHTAKRTRYELRFKEPKTKRSRRTIALPRFAVGRLRRHRVEQAERFLHAGAGRPDGGTLLFERDGLPWNPNTFGLTFARIARDAKLPKVRLHDLRHSFASLLLAGGADLKTVSTALGHSTIAVTADTYAHVSPAMLHDAANLLDRVVASGRRASGQ
ncbi:MAG: site-specific integrase [Candidatus Cybelea sp.]|jgi:integrase